jgi:SHS2 domain-containing protein
MDMVTGKGFRELEHTADWSLLVWGSTMAELLEAATWGMLTLSGAKPEGETGTARQVELEAQDGESLLVGWLEEVLFQLETHQRIPIDITLAAGELWLRGKVVEAPASGLLKPIKAVTYHDLKITKGPEGLEARLVFDV